VFIVTRDIELEGTVYMAGSPVENPESLRMFSNYKNSGVLKEVDESHPDIIRPVVEAAPIVSSKPKTTKK
jgi:hypothetical protein